jgi:hypothetical protein
MYQQAVTYAMDSHVTIYFCFVLYRYESETLEAVVPADGTGSVSLNFTLLRDNPELWSSRSDYGLKENLMSGKYLSNAELRQVMAALDQLNPSVAELQTISMAAHPITSLKLTHEVCIYHGVQFNYNNYHKTN